MPAKSLPALSMSQTKEDLVKYLRLQPETYSLMAKETDTVYKWLTTGTQHLKSDCTRSAPYDWSDISEQSKEKGMIRLAASGDAHTSKYWKLADERTADGCPNWIARWFLYHKFRYRDGRNRGKESRSSKYESSKGRGGSGLSMPTQLFYSNSSGSPSYPSYITSPAPKSYQQLPPIYSVPPSHRSDMTGSSGMSVGGSIAVGRGSMMNKSVPPSSAAFYDPVKGYWRSKD